MLLGFDIEKVMKRLFRDSCKGTSLVEFCIILVLLILLVGGAVDWGNLFYLSQNVQNGARRGARLAAVEADLASSDTTKLFQAKTRVVNSVKNSLEGLAFVVPQNITVSVSDLTDGTTLADCDKMVTVSVSATYSPIILGTVGFTQVTLTRRVTMRHDNQTICI